MTVRTVFPNPKEVLLPGMYVRAILEEGVDENAILVPQQGVTRDQSGDATALVVGESGKVELRVLKVGRTIGDKWLVESGLKPGDRVIVEGTTEGEARHSGEGRSRRRGYCGGKCGRSTIDSEELRRSTCQDFS